ncbi:4-galactosyl-N-acetylglucosaminide 3-alpha-L-fucosyltransferase FUT6-like [Leptidea sinapis]|uniref:4-galactosyl-N-acetylglucosaminide 3-alpha-L-fucosyltransferase FUT6-like n=1 Tax=Leptidea sinapis TaxID=189913 RepID=UPI002142E2ED|nr:4-galactosyl-N-acetylglucosaminide 3-alpha-L-fucosyltransferase FUT6-like [Leptidea sinapis]
MGLKKIIFVILSLLVVVYVVVLGYYTRRLNSHTNAETIPFYTDVLKQHEDSVRLYINNRQNMKTSKLGTYLFKNVPTNVLKSGESNNKTFSILIWKYWDWLQNRHLYNYQKRKQDPFEGCSVNNCILTGNDTFLITADAVVIHIQKGVFPNRTTRNPKQRWIFLSDESPINVFSMARVKPQLSNLADMFNWSMTFRSDADVPVPYGRTVPLSRPLIPNVSSESLAKLVPNWNIKRRDKLATVLMSNCAVSRRMQYLEQLEKYLPLDVFGKCSKNNKNTCPGHFKSDCPVLSQYLFYLVLENSQCREYLTEKVFYNALDKGAIPVIMGAPLRDCERLLPPNSFVHVDNFESPESLASYIMHISRSNDTLLEYHKWRNSFEVVNEHGYFGSKSFHYCRVCEALNYNDGREKVYNEKMLRYFLDDKVTCLK